MIIRFRLKYTNYPLSKELTEKSLQLARMTHPLSAMVLGALPGTVLCVLFQSSIALILASIGMIAGMILAPGIRKKKSAKLDEEYAKLLVNMQK